MSGKYCGSARSGIRVYTQRRAQNTRLITGDRKLIQAFPDIAMTAKDYLLGAR